MERDVHVPVVSFPFSNMRFAAAFPGENTECVCAELITVSERIGRIPGILVFDSATGAGHRFGREAAMTRVSDAFRAHCRIGEARFSQSILGL